MNRGRYQLVFCSLDREDPMKLSNVCVAVSAVLYASSGARAAPDDEPYSNLHHINLRAEQKAKILAGEQVVYLQNVWGYQTPAVVVTQEIKATPEQVVAVMTDMEVMGLEIPSTNRAEVVLIHGPRKMVTEFDYMGLELYRLQHEVQQQGNAEYHVEWNLVAARLSKAIFGHAHIQPFGNTTLFQYNSLASLTKFNPRLRYPQREPKSSANKAPIARVARSFKEHIERMLRVFPHYVDARVRALRGALAGTGEGKFGKLAWDYPVHAKARGASDITLRPNETSKVLHYVVAGQALKVLKLHGSKNFALVEAGSVKGYVPFYNIDFDVVAPPKSPGLTGRLAGASQE
jgi:hypothetical protein